MKKLITAVLAGTAVASVAFASASSLGVNGGVIQAGEDGSLYCDIDGVSARWAFESKDSSVHFVTIEGIDEACYGATLWVKTNLQAGQDATGVTIDASSERVNFATPVPAQALESLSVVIEG